MVSYGAQAGLVALVTVAWAVLVFALLAYHKEKLSPLHRLLFLPTLCFGYSVASIVAAAALATAYGRKDVPLVTPFGRTWFSIGWTNHLAFMGVLVDSPVAYGLIINYQVARCIAGSLLSNAFQPYVTALQSNLVAAKTSRLSKLLLARVLVDVFGFVSSLSDLVLYVSQVDIFLVSGVTTTLVNLACTYWLLEGVDKDKKIEKDIERLHTEALFVGGARLRL